MARRHPDAAISLKQWAILADVASNQLPYSVGKIEDYSEKSRSALV